jgi:rRNA maturation endonuclease Nob1|tara:strand:- start:379 stop:636 length:258 start_codon:yes stop_codon:yes gene_type:complete
MWRVGDNKMANSHKATWNKTDYSKIGTKKMKPKRKTVLKNKIKRVGTQIFNYKDICHICGKLINVDINDECKACEKSMRAFRGIK